MVSDSIKNRENAVLISALFVHAARMDENYTEKEKKIIFKAMSEIFNCQEDELNTLIDQAEKKEMQSNQILEFTKEVKKLDKNLRFKVLEVLWKIIYSDGVSDMYESSLMRKLGGLLYVSDKELNEVKKSILSK